MPYEEDPKKNPQPGVNEPGEEKKEETFSFLQETIKPKEISREKILMQLVRIALYGLILGVFFCCGFYALRPWAESRFQGSPETVTIPEDEEDPEEVIEEVPAAPVLTAESYEQMMQSLYETAQQVEGSVVTVRQATAAEEWDGSSEESRAGTTGLIAADNGQEILILTDISICTEAEQWNIEFRDGSSYAAGLKKKDGNSGLAVFSIPRSDLSAKTWETLKVAALGNSNLASQGDVLIAMGSMFGYGNGMGYGVVSSVQYEETFADGQCEVIATDIAATKEGTGVLFNQSGEVVGLMLTGVWRDAEQPTANALAISDLKTAIERLLNGESVPYSGIYGVMVTDDIAEAQGIPVGLYVTEVEPDSPAMEAGIQSGDVLQQIGDTKISTLLAYKRAVLNRDAGDKVNIQGQRRGAGGYVEIDFTVTLGSKE